MSCPSTPSGVWMENALLNRSRAEPGSIVGSMVGWAGVARLEPADGVEKLTVGKGSSRVEPDDIELDAVAGNGVDLGVAVVCATGDKAGKGGAVMVDLHAANEKYMPAKTRNRKKYFM